MSSAGDRAQLRYLPAALEIEATPPSAAGRAIALAIALLFVTATGWAVVGEVEIVAVARGQVIPVGHSKPVQSAEGGRVRAIHVTEGEWVARGDLLIELDDTAPRSDLELLQQQGRTLAAKRKRTGQLLRWLQQPAGTPPPRGQEHAPGVRLVDAHWREQLATVERLRQQGRAERAERAALRQQIDKGETLLPIQRRQADGLKQLWQQQALPEYQYLEAERRAIEQRFELAALRQQVVQLDARLAATEAAVDATQAAFLRRLLEQREALDLQLVANPQALVKARQRLDGYQLRSPANGEVQQLAVHTAGAVVTPAQQLLQVVPGGQPLEVEALLENRDVGFVRPGQTAAVKLDSYPFTRHGTLPGRVAGLSASAISERGDRQRYRIRVALERETLAAGASPLRARPGMAATVEMRTGRRRVIDYLLSPLRKVADESLRER